MPIKCTVEGFGEVTADTVAELIELKRFAEGAAPFSTKRRSETRAIPKAARDGQADAITVLNAIAEARPGRLHAEELRRRLGLSHVKGVGSVLARVRKTVSAANVDVDAAFTQTRGALGREYRAGPRLDDALAAVTGKRA